MLMRAFMLLDIRRKEKQASPMFIVAM